MNNNRRTFLKKIGLGTIAASNIPGFASAESLLRSNNPEKLNFQLERTERSYNGEYRNEYLSKVAFPIGGIGAGMFCLEGTGAISHLSVNHRPEIYNTPYAFAAISIKGIKNGAKVLESTVPTWKLFGPRGSGNGLGNRNYGLPRFEKGSFRARFPFGIIDLEDKDIPLDVKITGWSPFIPTDEDNSSLPIGVLEYSFKNRFNEVIEAVFSYNARNFIDEGGYISGQKNGFRMTKAGTDGNNGIGGFAVYLDDNNAVTDHCWFRGGWFDSQTILWDNIRGAKIIGNAPIEGVSPGASVYLPVNLKPGEEKTVKVNFCWYLPKSDLSIGQRIVTGPAFTGKATKQPVKGQQKVSGYVGEGLLNSFDPNGDGQVGTLLSPEFTISKRYLKFLVGGGNQKGKTSVNLWINDRIVETAVGNNTEQLTEVIWDLKKYAGKTARLKIIDLDTFPWGHILADQFVLTDRHDEILSSPSSGAILLADFEGDYSEGWEIIESEEVGVVTPGNSYYRPWYATRFENLDSVIGYWNENCTTLKKYSELFSKSFYDSTLPPEVLEAVAANLTILKSPTVLRVSDGRLWAWEGCNDDSGCCHGSCTHVWNYAQAIPHLFPALERTLRETEFKVSQNEEGHQNFRTNIPITPTEHNFHAAADGQLGGIMKVYRDWRISGDTEWMKSLYPYVKKSLDYCIRTWDPKGKGCLEEPHHNTYDIEFWGPDGMCTSFYLGALTAFIEMSKALRKPYNEYHSLLTAGKKYIENDLFDGEYFIQKIQWEGLEAPNPVNVQSFGGTYSEEAIALLQKEGPKYQYGTGCLSDGILGMWMASVCGLPEIIDNEMVTSHLKAVHKYNLKTTLLDHYNPQRPTYACGEDGGLLLCSWPKGGALSLPFVYSNEVWTGIEYQVASHLMLKGEIEKGLEIVRVCRDRYDGSVRNPFNEYECGHWYARAMASYAMIQALTGIRYDAVDKILYIDSKIGDFTGFISTGTGFGTLSLKNGKPRLEVLLGSIDVKKYNIFGKEINP
ncbi:GH116 family glycosyl hydrolase [Proteiniphilum saccharofermentans]|uniref:GH116 family glycosyl hydrolase n=1 Tax=Proteiniphilum saccharofermentans TaxID=1642647 RepID=UPI0028AA1AE4|nr:GH116 family glycosyl hydrolase [Proteiniphilum saccharofermentans]